MSTSNAGQVTILPGIPMPRSHLYLPITDPAGQSLSYVTVTVVETGTSQPINDILYANAEPDQQVLDNPATFPLGVIDIWSARATRADLRISGPNNFQRVITVDFLPRADNVVRGAWASRQRASVPGLVLRNDGWGDMTSVAPHQHDGTQSGSTYLDPTNATAADTTPGQTWVGAGSASTAADSTGGSALGAGAQATNVESTALGEAAIAVGSHSTVVGQGSDAAADYQTILGSGLTGGSAGTVLISADDESGVPSGIGPTALSLRGLFSTATATRIGIALATPATPTGVTYPFSLRGDVAIPGNAHLDGNARLGSTPASVLALLGALGGSQTAAPGASGIPALDSLVQALKAYGLYS